MKQIIAFGILFCLVFLNVPKTFIHHCEHDTTEHHDEHKDVQSGISVDNDADDCFICEFDLGLFNLPELKIPAFTKFINYTFNKPSVDYIDPTDFYAFSHRGPPTA